MCEHSGKLVAWMDGELEGGEAANIQHHLADCADCRLCVSEFRRITGEFAEHCDAVLKSVQPARNMWVPLRWAAVTACAVGLMFAMLAHRGTGVEKPRRPPAATDSAC